MEPAETMLPPARQMMRIGWASTDITPPGPVILAGMPWARVAATVRDPLTATALAIEAPPERGEGRVIMISCDLRNISDALRDRVRSILRTVLPEMDPMAVILNGTHTHTAPPLGEFGIDLEAMDEAAYVAFAAPVIAEVARSAWQKRRPGGISFGLTHAVVGHNRVIQSMDGTSRMYGATDDPAFSHPEGAEDHSINLLYTWDERERLTGVVINLSLPSQCSANEAALSADFWHEARLELRCRLGKDLFVLPQCSASGDQSPTILIDTRAEARMARLSGLEDRRRIALRITEAACSLVDLMKANIEWSPTISHRGEVVALPRRVFTHEEVQSALAASSEARETYERLLKEIQRNPAIREQPEWHQPITIAYRTMRQGMSVEDQFNAQLSSPTVPTEMHVICIGEMAIATNPFELYVDFGLQIKARSKATQTFVVQLAGGGTYLPTARALAGGAYGTTPTSCTQAGPDAGRELVNWTVETIESLLSSGRL